LNLAGKPSARRDKSSGAERSLASALTVTVMSEAEHFYKCPKCGGYVDKRDLAQVFEHEGPLPHAV
jgi:hypothetical protein